MRKKSANEGKRAQMQVHKERQKGVKERFLVKIANNQVGNNQVWELPSFLELRKAGKKDGQNFFLHENLCLTYFDFDLLLTPTFDLLPKIQKTHF